MSFAAFDQRLQTTLSSRLRPKPKLDEFHASLSRAIDESRAEMRAMVEQVLTRLDASTPTRNEARRSRKP